MLLEKAALRRFILPAVLRELLLTGCVLKPVVLAHCEETCSCSWSPDSTAEEVARPKRPSLYDLQPNENVVSQARQRDVWFSLDYAYGKLAEIRDPPYLQDYLLVVEFFQIKKYLHVFIVFRLFAIFAEIPPNSLIFKLIFC